MKKTKENQPKEILIIEEQSIVSLDLKKNWKKVVTKFERQTLLIVQIMMKVLIWLSPTPPQKMSLSSIELKAC